MDSNKKPTFFWQGALILLPMFALTLIGLFSLWRDQINSRREADERAAREASLTVNSIAAQFHPFPSNSINVSTSSALVKIDLFGETCRFLKNEDSAASLFAVDAPGAEQTYRFNSTESWASTPLDKPLEDPVCRLALGGQSLRFCLLDARGNLSYPPPLNQTPQPSDSASADDFAAQAQYRSGLLFARAGDLRKAHQSLDAVAANYPRALSESGLPLQVLARYQSTALSVASANSSGQTLIALAATAVLRPSALTAPILDQVKSWTAQTKCSEAEKQSIDGWFNVWAAHERSREIWLALRRAGPTNWLQTADTQWIASETKNTTNSNLLLARPAEQVRIELARSLERSSDADYFAVRATLVNKFSLLVRDEGRFSLASEVIAPDQRNQSLAFLDIPFPGDPQSSLLKVDCRLERPDLLYAAQKRRQIIFALFLCAAAISAAAGFVTAKRAFGRQLHLSEMKSNFVSAISHELRAPIASVRLMAEGLDRGKISELAKQKEYFRFIVQECRRLTSLIENVLDFSRIEQGRKKYDMEPTDLIALTQQTLNVLLPYAAERQVAIEARLPCGPFPQPSCDGLAIQQALVNLIDNAVKHSQAGSAIVVGLELAGAEPFLHLWVEDYGPGIPPEEHQKIFERFYRRGTELRRETQGVGIGLTIVKHIVESHGGRVLLRSAPAQGSRFTIELPITPESKP